MSRNFVRTVLAVALAAMTAFASACGSSEDPPANAKKLSFELTDDGCLPSGAKAPAGPVVFEVENTGTAKVTEFEVLDGEEIVGEKENLTEGLSGEFDLDLDPGKYTIYCPGGTTERGTLTVSG
jgi:iron uptake system component EfeO